jgi:hypothetical protein
MGLRETLNERPKLGGILAGAFVVAALLIGMLQVIRLHPSTISDKPERAFFTTDDGKTWFVDEATRLAPFDHDGKEAVRCYVVECNGKRAVNHLERYTDEGKQAMAKVREAAKHGPPPGMLVAIAQQRGREVKRPGDAKWTKVSQGAAATAIITPHCPDGTSGDAKFVFP